MTRPTFLRNSLALLLLVAALPLFGWELGDPKSAYNELLDVTSVRTVASKHGQLVLYKVNSATFAVRLDERGRTIDSGARAIDIEIDSAASDGENYYLAGKYGLIRIARDGSI